MGYVALSPYQAAPGIDFGPVNQAFAAITQQNNADRNFGLQQKQIDAQTAERTYQHGRDAKQDSRLALADWGKAALAIGQLEGPERDSAWQAKLAEHQRAFPGQTLTPEEMDPVTGPKLMAAQAGLYNDPRDSQAKDLELQKTRAEIKALSDKDAVTSMFSNLLNQPDASAAPAPGPGGAPQVQPQSFGGAPINPVLQQASMSGPVQPGPTVQAAQGLRPGVQLTADNGTDQPAPEDGSPSPAAPGAVYAMPGNEPVQTPFGTMSRDKARKLGAAAAIAGKSDLSKILLDAATGGGGHLSKSGATINDKEELGATKQIATLNAIKDSYNSKYLNIPKRFGYWGKAFADKFGGLSETDKQDLAGYTAFRQSAWHNLNSVLKDLSGTAVTENEMQRQLLDQPNAGQTPLDGDSPTEFETKLKGSISFGISAVARARYLRSQGFVGVPWGDQAKVDELKKAGIIPEVQDMPRIINQRGSQLEQQLKQQNPNADPMQLKQAVTKQIKQEFGI